MHWIKWPLCAFESMFSHASHKIFQCSHQRKCYQNIIICMTSLALEFFYKGFYVINHTGIILCMGSANERWRWIVTLSLISWSHTQNDLYHLPYFWGHNYVGILAPGHRQPSKWPMLVSIKYFHARIAPLYSVWPELCPIQKCSKAFFFHENNWDSIVSCASTILV